MSPDFGTLAQRIVPRYRRRDLVLPAAQSAQVDEMLAAMANHIRLRRERDVAAAPGDGGLWALFAGPTGTGKTMAAEVIAAELGVPVYRVDLSQVIGKFIGETEKNLNRVFGAAESANAILFFDEADALFGKRTGVNDAHDRYANIEVSDLLDQMERFNGLAILASNLRSNIDEAFSRRLRYVIDFPVPPARRI